MIFDLLRVESYSMMERPYAERRGVLEALELTGRYWHTHGSRTEGRCSASLEERGLEGVVCKRLGAPYRPSQRDWIKVKNRNYWRFGE